LLRQVKETRFPMLAHTMDEYYEQTVKVLTNETHRNELSDLIFRSFHRDHYYHKNEEVAKEWLSFMIRSLESIY
jgi:hypothetical protein